MAKAYVFTDKKTADALVEAGYPKEGKDLEGNPVKGKGLTLRAANVIKHPTQNLWYVFDNPLLQGADKSKLQDIDYADLFPNTGIINK